ncbi:MAG: EcsC family protein [SAR324 cluster bacterium]|nr:EcsC family protein [SAR324 cluster bacterium]
MIAQEAALSHYEEEQIQRINEWQTEAPSVFSKTLEATLSPMTWLLEKIIPGSAIQGILQCSNVAAEWVSDTEDIQQSAQVMDIEELRQKDLGLSDKLANDVHNWAIGLASLEGGASGAVGWFGMAVDIPTIITLALRTIHKIGACYGYERESKEDGEFILAILSASGANNMEQKITALTSLRSIEKMIASQTWAALSQKAVENKISQEAAAVSIKALASQLGVNLTRRKVLQVIPAVGAAVGASVNAWYIKEVGWTARRAFQERWLVDNNKIIRN